MRQHQCAPGSPRNTTVTVVGPFVSVLEVRSHPALLLGNQANLPTPGDPRAALSASQGGGDVAGGVEFKPSSSCSR